MTATSLREGTTLVYHFDVGTDGAFWLARQLCEQWLRERRVRSDAVCDLVLAMSELVTGATGAVVLRLDLTDDGVEIEVETAGGANVEGPSGDLRLAAALCDELVLRVEPDRTVVRARRHGVVLPG